MSNKEYKEVLEQRFNNGTESAKRVYVKHIQSKNTVSNSNAKGGAFYSPSTNTIELNLNKDLVNKRGAGTTWFHEHGHYVDNALNNASSRKEYVDAIQKDIKNFESFTKSVIKDQLGYNPSINEVRQAISAEFLKIGDVTHGLQDILSSKNGYDSRWCHERAYWNTLKKIGKGAEVEAFAHMFEANFDIDKAELFKSFFPYSWQEFNKILGE